MNKKVLAIFYAILASVLYAINIPLSKILLKNIEPTLMASYLYLGAGIGVLLLFLITNKKEENKKYQKYTKKDNEKQQEII